MSEIPAVSISWLTKPFTNFTKEVVHATKGLLHEFF